MEVNKAEVAVIEKVLAEVNQGEMVELADLQLLVVGGGCGEVVFA